MKQLRILTGHHAGVQIDLSSRRYRIGSDDDADIQIIDWRSDSVVLQAGDNDMFHLAFDVPGSEGCPPAEAEALLDFVARRIGDIVLCMGPSGAPWPSDISLLSGLMTPGAAAAPGSPAATAPAGARWRPAAMMAVIAAAAAAALAGVAHFGRGAEAATEPALTNDLTSEMLAERVARALAGHAGGTITVTASGRNVRIQGLVARASDVAAVRERLSPFPALRLIHAYAASDDVVQRIADGLALPGVKVTHQGGGVFLVGGAVQGLEQLRQNVAQIARDLQPLVQRIDVVATALPSTDHLPLSAVMVGEEVQYVQTRDGVKHLKVTPPAAAAAPDDPPADAAR